MPNAADKSERDGFIPRRDALLLGVILLAGLGLRLYFIGGGLRLDESVTWDMFVSRGPAFIVTHYTLPNNHILHSLLVWLAVTLFGYSEAALRVPALIAGELGIAAIYFLARRFELSRFAALLAAALLAISPIHIVYSVLARGYSLIMLLAVLMGIELIAILKAKKLDYTLGALLGVTGFLGNYTMPSFLPTAAAVAVGGCAAVWLQKGGDAAKWEKALLIAAAFCLSVLLSAAAYFLVAPHLMINAARHLIPFADATGDFFAVFKDLLFNNLLFGYGIPALLFFALGLWEIKKQSFALFAIMAAVFLTPLLFVAVARATGPARVFLAFVPYFLLAAVYGLILFGKWAGAALKAASRDRIAAAIALLIFPMLIIVNCLRGRVEINQARGLDYRLVAANLERYLKSGDVTAIPVVYDIPLSHYLNREKHRQYFAAALLASRRAPRFLFLMERDQFAKDDVVMNIYYQATNMKLHLPVNLFRGVAMFGDIGLYEFNAMLKPVLAGPDFQAGSHAEIIADSRYPQVPLTRVRVPPGNCVIASQPFFEPPAAGILWLVYAVHAKEAGITLAPFAGTSGNILPGVGLSRLPDYYTLNYRNRFWTGSAQFHLIPSESPMGIELQITNPGSQPAEFWLMGPRMWFSPASARLIPDIADTKTLQKLRTLNTQK